MPNPQLQSLRLYAELLSRRPTLAATLTLTHGPQSSATGLAAAVSIAGGTSLLIDPDTATVKSVFRSGGLDFIVTNLDEALRVLKNELRKHTPLSVALTADPTPILAEMHERGVQPDLEVSIAGSQNELSSRPEFPQGGDAVERPAGSAHPDASTLALAQLHLITQSSDQTALIHPTPHATAWLAARNWSEHFLPTETTADLRTLDVRLIHLISDIPRLQWLRRIPHYHRPAPNSGRALWLTPVEHEWLSSPQPTR